MVGTVWVRAASLFTRASPGLLTGAARPRLRLPASATEGSVRPPRRRVRRKGRSRAQSAGGARASEAHMAAAPGQRRVARRWLRRWPRPRRRLRLATARRRRPCRAAARAASSQVQPTQRSPVGERRLGLRQGGGETGAEGERAEGREERGGGHTSCSRNVCLVSRPRSSRHVPASAAPPRLSPLPPG